MWHLVIGRHNLLNIIWEASIQCKKSKIALIEHSKQQIKVSLKHKKIRLNPITSVSYADYSRGRKNFLDIAVWTSVNETLWSIKACLKFRGQADPIL